MPHYIVSYDLNGPTPTHAQMDQVIHSVSLEYARVLETVWYIRSATPISDLADRLNKALSPNDQLLVVSIDELRWRNLLVGDQPLKDALAKS